MEPGDSVRILAPFTEAFPGVYQVNAVEGSTTFLGGIPEDFANAFDVAFLEVVDV